MDEAMDGMRELWINGAVDGMMDGWMDGHKGIKRLYWRWLMTYAHLSEYVIQAAR